MAGKKTDWKKVAAGVVALLLFGGCGATYRVTRTMPEGGSLEAYAWTSEKSERIEFTFSGDLQTGAVQTLTFRKVGAEPVNLTAQTLQALLSALPVVAGGVP